MILLILIPHKSLQKYVSTYWTCGANLQKLCDASSFTEESLCKSSAQSFSRFKSIYSPPTNLEMPLQLYHGFLFHEVLSTTKNVPRATGFRAFCDATGRTQRGCGRTAGSQADGHRCVATPADGRLRYLLTSGDVFPQHPACYGRQSAHRFESMDVNSNDLGSHPFTSSAWFGRGWGFV